MRSRYLVISGFMGKFGETDGVTNTYKHLIPCYIKKNIPADFLIYGPSDEVKKNGSVRIITHKPRAPVQIDQIRWVDPFISGTKTARFLKESHYKLVQISTPDPMGFMGLSIAKKNDAPVISIFHTALEEYAEVRVAKRFGHYTGTAAKKIMSLMLKAFFNQSDLILAPSIYTQKFARKMYDPPVKILTRGVDVNMFSPKNRTRRGGPVRAIYVGRIALEKNLDMLAKIFKNIHNIELRIVGDGNFLEDMKRMLPNAKYKGSLHGKELQKEYANADFFVFPSKTDTYGQVILEAHSSGLPAIVTDKMGPKDIIGESKAGYISKNMKDFKRHVMTLAHDSALRKRLSKQARTYAETRTWDAIFEELMKHYDDVLKARRKTI